MEQEKDNIIIQILSELYRFKKLSINQVDNDLTESGLIEQMAKTSTCLKNLFTLLEELETRDGEAPYLKDS